MTDLSGDQEPTDRVSTPWVLVIDVDGPSAYRRDGITLLERWVTLDPLNNLGVVAITKTTALRLPSLLD